MLKCDISARMPHCLCKRLTILNSGHERNVNDWLDEIDKLVRVMKGRKDDPYERVKIAIIDSGLNDTVKTRYMARNEIVYKDFTNQSGNDSWHGTCCAKIISDIYEEAILFIARIFEKDDANEEDGPIRMAKVTALTHPLYVLLMPVLGHRLGYQCT